MSPTYGIVPPDYRLPDATHVGAVRLQVSDLGRSIAYYEQVVGLRVHSRTADAAVLGPHDDPRVLIRLEEMRGIKPAPRRGAFGLFHFAILLPGRGALGRFAAHLAARGERIGMADHLVSQALYLTDPDGLGIEVYADRPKSTWRTNGRELMMATDPLSLDDLIAAGGARRWEGAPAGTIMGHVHLHVGSLNDAEAFYHAALGFDKTVWNYPGALFMSAGGYHHHLATNTWSPGPSATEDQARLLEWELIVPRIEDVSAAAESVGAAGYPIQAEGIERTGADPWGTRVRVRAESNE